MSTGRGLSLSSLISFMLLVMQLTSVLLRLLSRRELYTHSAERRSDNSAVTLEVGADGDVNEGISFFDSFSSQV